MNLAILRSWFVPGSRWEKAAFLCWGAILLFVGVRVFIQPQQKTVYPIFSKSAQLWWGGGDLYQLDAPRDTKRGFRYGPSFAILATPFAFFPDAIGGNLWRLFNAVAFLAALAWLARTVLPGQMSAKQYAWLLLLVLPLSLQSMNNGQANLVVIAAMLGMVAAVKEERWNLASVLMAIAFIIKIYPLALGLVLLLLYPRQLSWRLPLAVLASLLLPFACQDPHYVVEQYQHWFALLHKEDRSRIHLEHMYRDLWLLIYVYDIPLSRTFYQIVQVAAGAGVAVLCWHRQRSGWSASALLTSTLALTTAWMMLLGPATESSSFALLAPSLAWSVVEALRTPAQRDRRLLLWGSCAFFGLAVFLGAFANTVLVHGMGVHSWGSLLYFVYLLKVPTPAVVPAVQGWRLAAQEEPHRLPSLASGFGSMELDHVEP